MAGSRGIKIYGTYALVFGILNVTTNLGLAVILSRHGAASSVTLARMLGVFMGVLLAISGVGIFLLKPWGRVTAMFVAACRLVDLLVSSYHLPQGISSQNHIAFVGGNVILLMLNASFLWFFTRPTVVAQFRKP